METLDDIVRFSAFGLLLWLAVLALRDFRDRLAGWLGALSAITAASYLLATKVNIFLVGVDVDILLMPMFSLSPAFSWLFCLSQFDDNFKLTKVHFAVVLLKMVTGILSYMSYKWGWHDWLFIYGLMTSLIVLGISVHLVAVALAGRHEDLVEERRRFRNMFVTGIIMVSLGVLIAEMFLRDRGFNQELLLLQAVAFLAITVFLLWRLSSPGGEDLFFRAPNPIEETGPQNYVELSPADQHDLDVIKDLPSSPQMLEAGLTISKLSDDLRIPEHRLRHLINQHLGYRNFSDFLNHHRIERAKEQLSDQERRNIPVLTVAMELGYGSLGPFNRAFKERTGLTPTEFRTQSLEAGLAAAK